MKKPPLGGLLVDRAASMNEPVCFVHKQLVEDQRIGFLAEAPEHHENDDLEIFEVERPAGNRIGAVDHHLAHGGWQYAGRLEKADKTNGRLAKVFLLGHRIDPQTVFTLLADIRLRRTSKAIEP